MIFTIADDIMRLFEGYGHLEYGEGFTVLSHSIQSGIIAQKKGLDDELILAAYLHDIGHIVPLVSSHEYELMGSYGIDKHDHLGSTYLEVQGFTDRVIATVKNHVNAKRYLCSVDETYGSNLSEASAQTLIYQGGVMKEEEMAEFEREDYFEESIAIRRIDDEAKDADFEVLPEYMEEFRTRIQKSIGKFINL